VAHEAVEFHNRGAADRDVLAQELARTRASLAALRDRHRALQDECTGARPDPARLALEAAVRERDEEIDRLRDAAASALQLNTLALNHGRGDGDGGGPAVPHPSVIERFRWAAGGGGGGGGGSSRSVDARGSFGDNSDGNDDRHNDDLARQSSARLGELLDTCEAQANAIRALESRNAELAQLVEESQEGASRLELQLHRVTTELERLKNAEADAQAGGSGGLRQQRGGDTSGLELELKRVKELVVDLEAANDDDLARAGQQRSTPPTFVFAVLLAPHVVTLARRPDGFVPLR
jgi:DNA repair exonuclease SbcCD ATPase subunit